ncbi:hypothetical protein [Flavobacterium sp.]|nr:hypothetical protein [Flavobacterium sp.]
MKKLQLLFFLGHASLLWSQEKIPISGENVEKETDTFNFKEEHFL